MRERERERERTQRRRMLAATATVPFSFEGLCRREGEGDNVGSTDGRTDGQTGPPSRRAHNGGQMATGGGPGQGGQR